jgi:ATP-dependent Clp protease ATP-binding subunit ClpA
MTKRNKVTEAAPAMGDLTQEAQSLLRRLIDEAQLRDAVGALIDEAQSRVDDLPAAGQKASKETKKQLKAVSKRATKQLNKTKAKAEKQQRKLARKGAAAAAGGAQLIKQKKPGLAGRLVLILAGAVGALAVSETLRSKLLDLLFGAEEEFQYTPPEPPAGENPAPLSAV